MGWWEQGESQARSSISQQDLDEAWVSMALTHPSFFPFSSHLLSLHFGATLEAIPELIV